MNPREIHVHIDELVLHGFAPDQRWDIARAFSTDLQGQLAAQGVPSSWMADPEIIQARPLLRAAAPTPAATGVQLARAVYGGGRR